MAAFGWVRGKPVRECPDTWRRGCELQRAGFMKEVLLYQLGVPRVSCVREPDGI